jgi:hypothetical protein
MHRLLLLAALLAVGCKKEPPAGLPPADNWKNTPQGEATPAQPPPSGGAATNPHGGVPPGSDPHAGMDPSNPHGGGGAGMPPASDPHAGMGMGGGGAPKSLETLPDGRVVLGPFALAVPKEWVAKPVTSSMRAADWVLSAKPGEEAELIVYYFGAEGAGSVEANLDRWTEQFEQPDGKKSKDVAKVEKTKFGGQDATVLTVTGHYRAAAMPGGGEAVDKADAEMIAAIVSSPQGPYYFRVVGAKKTVDANAPKLKAMLSSLKLK